MFSVNYSCFIPVLWTFFIYSTAQILRNLNIDFCLFIFFPCYYLFFIFHPFIHQLYCSYTLKFLLVSTGRKPNLIACLLNFRTYKRSSKYGSYVLIMAAISITWINLNPHDPALFLRLVGIRAGWSLCLKGH